MAARVISLTQLGMVATLRACVPQIWGLIHFGCVLALRSNIGASSLPAPNIWGFGIESGGVPYNANEHNTVSIAGLVTAHDAKETLNLTDQEAVVERFLGTQKQCGGLFRGRSIDRRLLR